MDFSVQIFIYLHNNIISYGLSMRACAKDSGSVANFFEVK